MVESMIEERYRQALAALADTPFTRETVTAMQEMARTMTQRSS